MKRVDKRHREKAILALADDPEVFGYVVFGPSQPVRFRVQNRGGSIVVEGDFDALSTAEASAITDLVQIRVTAGLLDNAFGTPRLYEPTRPVASSRASLHGQIAGLVGSSLVVAIVCYFLTHR